jgi:hypothetical protein
MINQRFLVEEWYGVYTGREQEQTRKLVDGNHRCFYEWRNPDKRETQSVVLSSGFGCIHPDRETTHATGVNGVEGSS